jgi:glutamate--cysteine ligase
VPTPLRQLQHDDVQRHVADVVFAVDGRSEIGLELEWLTRTATGARPGLPALEALVDTVGPQLPRSGRLTIEPGGQLELSTQPHRDLAETCDATIIDLYVLDAACSAAGIELVALGSDPERSPDCLRSAEPRYAAMTRYFGDRWPTALEMMANTASIQVNVGYGADEAELRRRWHLAHALGPVLLATFANSPFAQGAPTGWQSSRWRSWDRLDPARTHPAEQGADPRPAWTAYALEAPVMCIRDADGHHPLLTPLPFGRWVTDGHELGWPTLDDLRYHLTTLFPPVRPRGWLELRYLDVLPTPLWHVAATVATTALVDPALGAALDVILADTTDRWVDAAQLGLGHPDLATAARNVFRLVRDQLEHTRPGSDLELLVATYDEHWVARGRSPADDHLDRWRATGEVQPVSLWPTPHTQHAGSLP